MSSDKDLLATARAALRRGDKEAAFQDIRAALSYPAAKDWDEARLGSAISTFAEIARLLADGPWVAKLRSAAAQPGEPIGLFAAGYALFEQHQPGIAATLLERANRLRPSEPEILAELAANLHAILAYKDARAILEASNVADDHPLLSYLLGYSAIMSGDLMTPRRCLGRLTDASGPLGIMAGSLRAMVERAEALRGAGIDLGDRALTAWHAVTQGSILLHESPHGYDEPMHGRYALVADTPDLMRQGLERLRAVIARAQRSYRRVVAGPDPASQILAMAAARVLDLPLVEWAPGEERDGVVVVWSLTRIEDRAFAESLFTHAPEQLLFVHASTWVDPVPFAPDVTTLLAQHVTNPFTGGALRADPDSGELRPEPPSTRPPAELAEEIVMAPIRNPSVSTLASVLSVLDAALEPPEPYCAGIGRRSGPRSNAPAGSPVSSARF